MTEYVKVAEQHYAQCRALYDAKFIEIARLERIVKAERDALARLDTMRRNAFGELQMAMENAAKSAAADNRTT